MPTLLTHLLLNSTLLLAAPPTAAHPTEAHPTEAHTSTPPQHAQPTAVPAAPATPSPAAETKAKPTLKLGAHAFIRGQARINGDFDADAGHHQPDVLQRVRISATGTLGASKVYVEVQDARKWGVEASTVSNDANTDLHQGYFQIGKEQPSPRHKNLIGWARIGRQEMNIGTKRLIADLGWAPNARAFDAIRLYGQAGKVSGNLFFALLNPTGPFSFLDNSKTPPATTTDHSRGDSFSGLHVNFKVHEAFAFEPMALLVLQNGNPSAPKFSRSIANLGARASGKIANGLFGYDTEGYVQVGEVNKRDHLAWAATADISVQLVNTAVKPKFLLRYSLASGEACKTGPEVGCGADKSTEFFNFFPLNHAYYGLVDLLGWRNMRDLEFTASLQAHRTLQVVLGYHFFQLHEARGRWTNAPGQVVGKGWDPNNTDHNLGNEIDLVLNYRPTKHLFIQPGYGIFLPTGAGKKLGGDDPQHFAFVWLISNFK